MWDELKKCQKYSDIHKVLGIDWIKGFSEFVIGVIFLMPVWSVLFYIWAYYLDDGNFETVEFLYSSFFVTIGIVIIIVSVFYLSGLFIINKYDIRGRIKQTPWLVVLLAMLLWFVPGTFMADDLEVALLGTLYRCDGLLSYFIYTSLFFLAIFVRNKKRDTMMLLLVVSAVFSSLMMFCQIKEVYIISDIMGSSATGTFYNENHLGYFFCISIMCTIYLAIIEKNMVKKCVYLFCVFFQVIALIENGTFASLIAVIIGCVFFLILSLARKEENKIIYIAIVVVFVAVVLNYSGVMHVNQEQSVATGIGELTNTINGVATGETNDYSVGNGRIQLWKISLDLLRKKPWFGYGPEGSETIFNEMNLWTTRPHNEFIQYALFGGIPAVILYLIALAIAFINRISRIKELSQREMMTGCAMFTYLISSFAGNTMFYTVVYFWIIFAWIYEYEKDF